MPTFKVVLVQVISAVVTVEAEDHEAAIEQAHDLAPGTLCASCSGWGNDTVSLDLGGTWEPTAVMTDPDGTEVWVEDFRLVPVSQING